MEKKSLKLAEYYQLEAELNGVTNNQTGEKVLNGLLSQKLTLSTKYWLTDLAKRVKEQTEACEALKNELIKKYGEEKDGQIQISFNVKNEAGEDVPNPKFLEFQNEYQNLLNEERELEYKELKLSDLGSIETEEVYSMFFSLLKAD
jgi:hypothetical protein